MKHSQFYALHFALVLVVVLFGVMQNGGKRKYIPVKHQELTHMLEEETQPCRKGYVNVHSVTSHESLATICCTSQPEDRPVGTFEDWYRSNICYPKAARGILSEQLPLAGRLTRMTEAWLIPLSGILLRLGYQIVSQSPLYSTSQTDTISTTMRRLLFYILVMNIRGWVLYIGANALEDFEILPWLGSKVVSPLRRDSSFVSDMEHGLLLTNKNDGSECWYKDLLKEHHKVIMGSDEDSYCYGRPFDFSDHVVLFCAHYLPVIVCEMLICYALPFWRKSRAEVFWKVLHAFHFIYMHFLLLNALYRTAVFFHTPSEVLVAYGISLTLALPISVLVCSKRLLGMRRTFGLAFDGENGKGD
mmetsp:Transcript_7186/g.16555  ORF Transcript_7186/g.16555 Transcript_7186/m.16555 type:complete len:359 (+) Transcript_7186:96-1172(+)